MSVTLLLRLRSLPRFGDGLLLSYESGLSLRRRESPPRDLERSPPRDRERSRLSSNFFPASAPKPAVASAASPAPPPLPDGPLDLDRDLPPRLDLPSSSTLLRDPLIRRLPARPPTTASRMWRLLLCSGSWSAAASIPPAPIAAVRIRFPLSPPQPPGSFLTRKASVAPASSAALAAC